MPLFQPRLSPQEETNIPTCICMPYLDVYACIMLTLMQACLLSDVITSVNRDVLFRSHNAIKSGKGQEERFRAFRGGGDI